MNYHIVYLVKGYKAIRGRWHGEGLLKKGGGVR